MKKRDLLLLGFVGLFLLSLGALTGYVPSPLLRAEAQHVEILNYEKERMEIEKNLLEYARLQLYLARETCLHGATTESEKSRCDRESIRDAIVGDVLASDTLQP